MSPIITHKCHYSSGLRLAAGSKSITGERERGFDDVGADRVCALLGNRCGQAPHGRKAHEILSQLSHRPRSAAMDGPMVGVPDR